MLSNDQLARFFKGYRNALFVVEIETGNIIYCNDIVTDLYGITEETKDVTYIFPIDYKIRRENMKELLRKEDFLIVYDIMTTTKEGSAQLADVQIDYLSEEKTAILIEVRPKNDIRMEMAMNQVQHSTRAEGIVLLDEELTLIHCNELLHEIFESDEVQRFKCFDNKFSNGFLPELKEALLSEIHENMQKFPVYFTKLKIKTSKGKVYWYSMELQKRTLDSTGVEKVMVSLVNIEAQVELEVENTVIKGELKSLSRYFDVMQDLTDDFLFRIDITNKELHRSINTTHRFGLTNKVSNFPQGIYDNDVVFPEDIPIYDLFAAAALAGTGGMTEVRMKEFGRESYEYRRIIWKPVIGDEGEITEIFGKMENIQDFHELKVELKSVNLYFDALQKLSEDMIFRVDIVNRTLIRHKEKASRLGLSVTVPDFPESVYENGEIHPDDVLLYKDFAVKMLSGQGGSTELRMLDVTTGEFGYRRLIWTPVVNDDGNTVEVFGKLIDIQSVRELEIKANYDTMTNTLNKRAMKEITSDVIMKSTRSECHALLFLDLDDFKFVNDNYGHLFGDILLHTLGLRLSDNVRTGDLIGRVGGDEFVLFLKNIPSSQFLLEKGKRLLDTISKEVVDGEVKHSPNGSVGVALFPEHGTTYEALYHCADVALYQSKQNGKNQVTLYSMELEKNKSSTI